MKPLPSALAVDLPNLTAKRRVVLFLDFDGTLTPIQPRPEDARLAPEVRETLKGLARVCPIAVVSGRDLPNLRRQVALPGIAYAGSHGFDIAMADGLEWHFPAAAPFAPTIAAAERALRERTGAIAGVQIERKRFSLSLHYRNAAVEQHGAVHAAVAEVVAQSKGLRDVPGKMVHELSPDLPWGKGHAVLWILARLKLEGDAALPVYLGDDRTDEDALAVLVNRGIGIAVGDIPQPTSARYGLRDPGEVYGFLLRLAHALGAA